MVILFDPTSSTIESVDFSVSDPVTSFSSVPFTVILRFWSILTVESFSTSVSMSRRAWMKIFSFPRSSSKLNSLFVTVLMPETVFLPGKVQGGMLSLLYTANDDGPVWISVQKIDDHLH